MESEHQRVAANERNQTEEDSGSFRDLILRVDALDGEIDIVRKSVIDLAANLTTLASCAIWPSQDESLSDWVNHWLIPTFCYEIELDQWERNPGVVSELAACYLGFQAMGDAPGFTQLGWHGDLERSIQRCREIMARGSSPGYQSIFDGSAESSYGGPRLELWGDLKNEEESSQ